ncbi:zinc finger protein 696 [Drosophila madeirensis]|uniref:Zinc finger protein 696 n=1 Tax=Drosophila madeirensis TaxID=30013 RepID=A0AAU9F4I7_DROMD
MCSTSVLCPLCAVPSFGSIDALQQRLIKAANGPLACPFSNCKELFLGLDKLTIHLFTHTSLMTDSPAATTPAAVTPPAAPPTAPTPAPKRRGKRSKGKAVEPAPAPAAAPPPAPPVSEPPASCDICEFSFRNKELRDMHIRLVHENGEAEGPQPEKEPQQEPYKCHLCSKTFRMKGSLRVHLKVVHMMGVPCSSQSGTTTNRCNAPSPKLNICDRIRHKEATASGSGPASSSTSSQPYALSGALSMLQQSPASPASPEAAASSTTKLWECDVCTKSFTTKYFLKKHKRLHTGEMPYTCEICARTFTFQQSYHKHLLYHSEVKPHVCAVCGRAFKELSTLHNHQRIHSGEKPFKCEVCGKCFRQRVSFLVHTRIHTGVMPYKCEVCQKTFRYKVSQRTHRCLSDDSQTPEQLIKAFLEGSESPTQPSPASAEIADINGCGVADTDQEALLSQTIDDIVVEQCQKLGICGVEPQQAQPVPLDVAGIHFNGSSSPLQQLQNLRLYSPQQVEMPSSDGDIFKRFLMDAT